ncbi:MAG: Coenzyme F420 hydrogenase/dehydrogenase, beta subunit C-terminal domain [Lachnospiraceae bacterium]|nr:Coenzyme F420 hydrogenase/dehydrogenase, beta subunit C-terminal domain [Lachnospiraceae bacterium]
MACTVKEVGKDICTGCGACHNICPVNAIAMQADGEGFLCPEINKDICTSCGLCYNMCPAVNEDWYRNNEAPQVYAAYASDEIRMKSSSGGMFTVLAEHIIDKGGYVAGVCWDEHFNAVFDVVNEKEKLSPMRGSKYVQSNTNLVFRKIKKLLDEGKPVLFTGVPCQAAGFRHYLGKDYDNLYIVDILCHGSPSPKSFKKFLDSAVKYVDSEAGIDDITSIEFRNKERHGWNVSVVIKLNNGKEYDKSRNETPWYNSFLNILNCRRVCGQCRYNKIPRQGDITLGDFWGIERLMPEIDFHKGVSVVTVNNEKGQRLFDEISNRLLFKRESNIEDAKASNWNLVGSSRSHEHRKRFFDLLDMYDSYDKITDYALHRKFDIGYVGWWYGKNYGSILTNFALHQYLKSKKKSVLMIEWPYRSKPFPPLEDIMSRRLGKKFYETSIQRTLDEHKDLNWFCDSFIVGSDQLWNYWSAREVDYFFFLDFAEDSKKKIAYATSFGHPHFEGPNWYLKNAAFHLNRFDYISVREDDGVGICTDTFGTNAVRNIDPVFICDKQEYINLINQSKIYTEKPYIFAYILNPTDEKRHALLALSEKTGLDIKIVLDGQMNIEENRRLMSMDDKIIVPNEINDWLSLIYNSDYVFTDSYHGLCFSLIFKKQFSVIGNIKRGLSRFTTLLDSIGLSDRLLFDPIKALDQVEQKVDYEQIEPRINTEIKRSQEWLDNALAAEKPCKASGYDLLMEQIRELRKEIAELKADK